MSLYSSGRASRSLIDTALFRLLSQAATVLGYVILVRGMSRQDFGVYTLLYAFIPVLSTFASLGLEQVLRRYQPEYLQAGNLAAAAWLTRLVAAGRLITNLVLLAILILAWNELAPAFKLGPYKSAFLSFSLLLVLHFQARVLQLALGSHMLHRYAVGSTALLSGIKLLGYGALYAAGTLTLEQVIVIDTVAYGAAYLTMRIAYQRQCLSPPPPTGYRPQPDERRRMIRYGVFNNFNDAGVMLLYSTLDTFFIAYFTDVVSVGIYGFFTRLNEMVANALPIKVFENVVQPMFFSTPHADAGLKVPQYFSFLLNMNLLLQWPVLATALAYHMEIVQLVSAGKLTEYSWLLPLVVGFATINVVADPVSLVAQYEERAGMLLFSKIFVVYNIVAMALLVPVLGVYGAALASGTAQTMKNAFIWWQVRRRAVWVNGFWALTIGPAIWGVAVLACVAIKSLLPGPPLLQLGYGVLVMSGALLIYVRSRAVSTSDRQILAAVVHGKAAIMLRRVGLLPPLAPPALQ